ncbi:MAG: hypothetical protein QCI38_02945 [Candidatus Thermoplasmatota archaeon]|nr:hypothetical protein [Candidatus Thermoplasmatota archaeon]
MANDDENGAEPVLDAKDAKKLEHFVNVYLNRYEKLVEEAQLPPDFMPDFYEAAPYKIDIHALPNGTFGLVFNSGKDQDVISIQNGEFQDLQWILEDKACERFLTLRNLGEASSEKAETTSQKDAGKDISLSRKKQSLQDMKAELEQLEGDMTSMAKVNPWLEGKVAGQMGRLSNTKNIVSTLEEEIAQERQNRFRDYISHLESLEMYGGGNGKILEDDLEEPEDEKSVPEIPKKDDDIPTLAAIASEHGIESIVEEELQEAPPPPGRKMKRKATPDKERPLFVEVKKEKVEPPKIEAPADFPPEIKKTIFRMNRRLYNLEKKLDNMDQARPSELKKLRGDFVNLQKQLKQALDGQNKRIDASAQALNQVLSRQMTEEIRKARKLAVGLGVGAIVLGLVALLLFLLDKFIILPF